MHTRFPNLNLVVRNFGRPAEEVGVQQRSGDYTHLDDPLSAFGADTFVCFFGFNESFAGPEGVENFKNQYGAYIDEYTRRYPRDDAKAPPRFVLISPLAFEATSDEFLPSGVAENKNLKLYAEAAAAVAAKRDLAFVDLFAPTSELFAKEAGAQYTVNGVHLNKKGDEAVGSLLDGLLFQSQNPAAVGSAEFEKLRAAVVDKSWVHSQDYRMVNGWYVYGGRRTWDQKTFPREYLKIRAMAAVRDQYVWDLAQGKPAPATPDDSETGELFVPPTRFGDPSNANKERADLKYLTPEEQIKTFSIPPGFEVKLFASEREFPQLAKPCQLAFDNKGRLWAGCMP
ncbi:MAG: DUF7133 domain-containing protein, partial [Planctomycetia bacterium]